MRKTSGNVIISFFLILVILYSVLGYVSDIRRDKLQFAALQGGQEMDVRRAVVIKFQ